MEYREVVTIKQAAELLKLSETTIRKLIKKGDIKAQKLGWVWRVYVDSLWICKRGDK
jgi:excisionase family DNA binding protein